MSYHGFGDTIRSEAGLHPRLALALVGLFSLPLSLIFITDLPWPAKLLPLALVLLGLRSALAHWALAAGTAPIVRWSAGRGWELLTPTGERRPARLLHAAWLWPRAVLLRLRTADGRRHWIALTDRPERDALRRLRVHLRWSGL